MAGRSDGGFVGVPFDKSDGFGFNLTLPTDLPSPTGRTDGVFTVVLPSLPQPERGDEVLVAFEHGDPQRADYSGSHVLYQDITIPTLAIDEYWL